MTDAAVFLGYPVEFKNLCLIYPPKVKDVAADKNYLFYEKILTISQEEIEDEWTENNLPMDNLLTPLEYLLNHAYHDKDFEAQARAAFMFFIHEPVLFLYEQKVIFIGDTTQLDISRILTEGIYFEFQNAIREACGNKAIEPPNPNENPRIKQMKAKARYRDRVKAKQGKGLKFISSLASICCMEMGLNPLNIGEIAYAAIPILMQTYQEKEQYHLDIDSLLAGADSKKVKPKYWIRNLED